jgi:D-sedoheptulose 7-phosphate isomerase
MQELVRAYFDESTEAARKAVALSGVVTEAALLIVNALKAGRRIFVCGNGGSAADAQHFAAELIGRFETERAALPCVALTTDTSILTAMSNDYGYDTVFARQVAALGAPGDVLVGISTSGNSASVERALVEGRSKGMSIVALLGRDGGRIGAFQPACRIIVDSSRTSVIQQVHITILHAWARVIDEAFRGA